MSRLPVSLTPDNRKWLEGRGSMTAELNRLVKEARLKFGDRGLSEDEMELVEIENSLLEQEAVIRKASRKMKALNAERDILIGIISQANRALADRRVELVLKGGVSP